MKVYGFLVLAAGSSSRLGQPKQLLEYNHKPLLQHAIDVALEVDKGPVFTVLGANAETIAKQLHLKNVHVAVHEHWQQGMGSSIAFGVQHMISVFPETNVILVLVCDQPLITPSLLIELIDTHEKKSKSIAASAYGDSLGTPVLFESRFFDHLIQLKGHEGAKRIILQHQEEVAAIQFPEGNIDVDTAADYAKLTGKLHVD